MKKSMTCLLAALALSSGAFANVEELTKLAKEFVSVQLASTNPDNSVTFVGIRLLRGDQAYEIDAGTTPALSVCKMLGYDSTLTGTNITNLKINKIFRWNVATLDEEGQFVNTIPSLMKFDKISCVNAENHKVVVRGDKSVNIDGSTTIRNIIYRRGDQAYPLDGMNTSFDAACKLFGFSKSLNGASLNQVELNKEGFWSLALIAQSGDFQESVFTFTKITKITCK